MSSDGKTHTAVAYGEYIHETYAVTTTIGDVGIAGDVTTTGNLKVLGDSTVGNAGILGDASIIGNVSVVGDSTVGGDMRVLGDSSVVGNAGILGDASIIGNVSVAGDSTIDGNLSFGDGKIIGHWYQMTATTIRAYGNCIGTGAYTDYVADARMDATFKYSCLNDLVFFKGKMAWTGISNPWSFRIHLPTLPTAVIDGTSSSSYQYSAVSCEALDGTTTPGLDAQVLILDNTSPTQVFVRHVADTAFVGTSDHVSWSFTYEQT